MTEFEFADLWEFAFGFGEMSQLATITVQLAMYLAAAVTYKNYIISTALTSSIHMMCHEKSM